MNPFAAALILTMGPMVILWLLSLFLRDASIVDVWWGLAFVVVAAGLVRWFNWPPSAGQGTLLALITIWGTRLALHIGIRNAGRDEDYRYQAMREHRGTAFPLISFVTVFMLQGALVWIVSLPVQRAMTISSPSTTVWLGMVGAAVWLVGFGFEAVGDWQLTRFKQDPGHAGAVLQSGVWRYTRHPNYFGDFMVWWGYFLVAIALGAEWWTAIGPLVMSVLLIKVSGVAMLEKTIGSRRPGYAEYVRRTNAFFPGPPRGA